MPYETSVSRKIPRPILDLPPAVPGKLECSPWLRRRRAAEAIRAALVEADAADLIGRFGARAYIVARDRDRSERSGISLDGNGPARHWSAVKRRIAASTKKTKGLDTASRYPSGR